VMTRGSAYPNFKLFKELYYFQFLSYLARSPVNLSHLQGLVLTTRKWPLLLAGDLKFA